MSEVTWPRYFEPKDHRGLGLLVIADNDIDFVRWHDESTAPCYFKTASQCESDDCFIEVDANGNELVREPEVVQRLATETTEYLQLAERFEALEAFHAAIVTAMNHEHNPTRFALAVSRALANVEQKHEVRCES